MLSDRNTVTDIDDENYVILLDLTKKKDLNAQHYESVNNDLGTIEFIEIEDDYAIKNFKDYYITR